MYASKFLKFWTEAEKRSTDLFSSKDQSTGDIFKEHRDVAILAPKWWITAANECKELFSLRELKAGDVFEEYSAVGILVHFQT